MASCCQPSCPGDHTCNYISDDDESGGDKNWSCQCGKNATSFSCESDVGTDMPSSQPYDVCPDSYSSCSNYSETWTKKTLVVIEDLYAQWKKIYKDPFKWDVVKSTLWFVIGVQLFSILRESKSTYLNKRLRIP